MITTLDVSIPTQLMLALLPDLVLMGGDFLEGQYQAPQGFTLSLQMSDTADAERIYKVLAHDGTVLLPLEKTFWAARFGQVVDRFGIPWQINCEPAWVDQGRGCRREQCAQRSVGPW